MRESERERERESVRMLVAIERCPHFVWSTSRKFVKVSIDSQ